MTDPRRQAFAPYVRCLADLMHLRDWHVEIDDDGPVHSDAIACARPCYGRKWLGIDLADSFLNAEPRSQRHAIVHELLHAHAAHMDETVGLLIGDDKMKAVHRLNLEYMVDAISLAWAESLPLPEVNHAAQEGKVEGRDPVQHQDRNGARKTTEAGHCHRDVQGRQVEEEAEGQEEVAGVIF